MEPEKRIENLNKFEKRLSLLLNEEFKNSYEIALHNTIKSKQLSPNLFFNLLKAFKQDVFKKNYESFSELLNYCENSANPVGRLILELNDIRSDEAFYFSDQICTALQLTNFYQDVSIDLKKGRIYLPKDEMLRFGVDESKLNQNTTSEELKNLLIYSIERTQDMFDNGKNLLKFLNGRLKLEINWTILGGEAILKKIKKADYNVLQNRPKLSKIDFVKLFFKSVI